MARPQQLLGPNGSPIEKATLTQEIAAPTLTGIRSPISGYPGDGLDPMRLRNILRAADHGDPIQYLELAEIIEERDPHYAGVLGTRKRSVSQIDITVRPASDSARDLEIAKTLEDWMDRDELTSDLFDILDAIGKGYSFTEIIWEVSMKQWRPARLERRDPRWFRFDRVDMSTPLMIGENGTETPLPAFKFIACQMKAKSGHIQRSGLARIAMWSYLFKKFSERDWAIFTQTFAQPLRVGKWEAGASEQDKEVLFKALASIAGDCAAMMPKSMSMEFIEAKNVGSAHALFRERCDWLDQQVSKAVLGQTTTTDAIAGGHAVSREHRQVQEDIERADAIALQGILNRDLVRPFVDLEYGPQAAYPKLIIARPEQEDLKMFSEVLASLVPMGLQVSEQEVLSKVGLRAPKPGEAILGQTAPPPPQFAPQVQSAAPPASAMGPEASIKYPFYTLGEFPSVSGAIQSQTPSQGLSESGDVIDAMTDQLAERAATPGRALMEEVRQMADAATSLEELREMLKAGYPELSSADLANVIGEAMFAAHAGGRAEIEDGAA